MATIGKYFVKGRFVGNFTTNQQKVLTSGDPFPKGDEHKVVIYRGIINQTEQIPVTNFDEAKGFYNFKEVNNIQINTSEKWPIKNDRIFSLYDMKLTHVEVFNVSEINGKTSGELRGNIIASVAEHPFNADNQEEPYNPGKAAEPFPTGEKGGDDPGGSDIGTNTPNPNPGGGDTGGDTTGGGNEITDRLDKFRKGCNTKWLRWLLYLLLILLLLYLLAKCTQAGQKIYCKIDNWRIVRKQEKVKDEIDTLQNRINQTLPVTEPCGKKIDFNGGNIFWDERFNIGKSDGVIIIEFDACYIPDRLEVIYDGELVKETNSNELKGYPKLNGKGFEQYKHMLFYSYKYDKNKPTELLLRVIPNKDEENTEWHIKLSCPQ